MGAWITTGSHLTYSPWKPGNEDPNKPPPGFEYKEGDPFQNHPTFLVKCYIAQSGPFAYKISPTPTGDDDAVSWQQIINWSANV